MKYSKQRELIINTLMENPIHPTADEIYQMVRKVEPKISLGTVYRNLNQLAAAERITKISVQNGSDRFDANIAPHIHMVCSDCGKICDLPCNITETLCENIEDACGYSVRSSDIVLSGICPTCKQVEANKAV